MRLNAGEKASDAFAMLRKLTSSTPRMITRGPPAPPPAPSGDPQRHDDAELLEVPAVARGLHERGVVGPVEEKHDLLGVDCAKHVEDVGGVVPDIHRLPA